MTLYCTPTTHPTSEASSSELLWVAECHDPFAPFEKFGATTRTDSYYSDIFPPILYLALKIVLIPQ